MLEISRGSRHHLFFTRLKLMFLLDRIRRGHKILNRLKKERYRKHCIYFKRNTSKKISKEYDYTSFEETYKQPRTIKTIEYQRPQMAKRRSRPRTSQRYDERDVSKNSIERRYESFYFHSPTYSFST